MIEIQNLHKKLQDHWVLDGLNLTIPDGQRLALLGPSGTGKSVFLKHIVGLMDPDRGEIYVDGQPVSQADGTTIQQIRSKISYVFQNSALFDSWTIYDNIRAGLDEQARDQWPETQIRQEVHRALERVNLQSEILPWLPAQLSGGMQKRVALARAVIGDKKYILYDEPTTGLDPVNASHIYQLIASVEEKLRTTDIIVTHDIKAALALADRAALLMDGQFQAIGTEQELRTSSDPKVREFLDTSWVDRLRKKGG